MRLRERTDAVLLALATLFLALFVYLFAFRFPRRGGLATAIAGAIGSAIFAILNAVNSRVLVLRHLRRAVAASRRDDAVEFRRLANELREMRGNHPFARVLESSALIVEERWETAAATIAEIDRAKLPPVVRTSLANDLAFCLAQIGRASEAVPIAEEALRQCPAAQRATILATLGWVRHVSGESGEAARLLQESLAIPGDPHSRPEREFELGEALRGLGRTHEARAAYQRAVEAGPERRYGLRAKQQLDALSTAPHR